jgi:hypothetical protein
MYAFIRICSFY